MYYLKGHPFGAIRQNWQLTNKKKLKNMEEKVIEIISRVLEVSKDEITLDTEIGELDEWDSLRNVQIFVELEKEFSVKITQSMLVDLENVADIIDMIKNLK